MTANGNDKRTNGRAFHLIKQAIELHKNGDLVGVENKCRITLGLDHGNPDVIPLLGVFCCQSGKNESAIQYLS